MSVKLFSKMDRKKDIFLSIIIPVFNEEKRVKNLIEVASYLKRQKYSWEVIVIDDGSIDKTNAKLKLLKRKQRFKLITYIPNFGKGYAIKTGMLAAEGKYRLFLDVDLSTPITEIEKLLPHLRKYDIIIGSRKMKGANLVIRQPILRESLGKLFTLLSRKTMGMNISDFTCGFKCFSKKAALQIFPLQTINRWGFDSEILYISKLKKHSIKELPVTWKDDPRTKVRFPHDILKSLEELIRIRINFHRGMYK